MDDIGQQYGAAGAGGLPSSTSSFSLNNNARTGASLLPKQSPQHQMGSGLTSPSAQQQQVVPTGFEEGVLRNLCDLDCGLPLMMDRIKQSMASCRVRKNALLVLGLAKLERLQETSLFFKKRAQIEEDYGRAMQKLSRERSEGYAFSDGKAGSFVTAFTTLLRTHDIIADNRIKMATQLMEMSEQLIEMAREVEKSRKSAKDLGVRLERNLTDSEVSTEKSRGRFDVSVEELEKILLSKAGENSRDSSNFPSTGTDSHGLGAGAGKKTFGKAMSKLKGGPKNPAQMQRMEEDARAKMNSMSDAYRQQVLSTQTVRQEYFNLQLPRMLKSLKETLDEIDLGTQFHISRYAFLYENMLLNEGLTVSPPDVPGVVEDGPGLKAIAESIDNRDDFKNFMQNYAVTFAASGHKVLRREGPPEEGFVRMPRTPNMMSPTNGSNALPSSSSSITTTTSTITTSPYSNQSASLPSSIQSSLPPNASQPPMYFGVDLSYQMVRDGVDVPKVLEKCIDVIDTYGLDITGIYRLSGTTSRIQRLKAKMEKDIDSVNLHSDENLTDINDISGILKLFFRELPEPLLTHELYHGFIEAAKIENSRLRHIRLHERINELPDSNYATCKALLGHLDRVTKHESTNSMSISNIAIVFGPTLIGPPPEDANLVLQDMQWQCKAVETILEHYAEIFVDAEDENGAEAGESKAADAQ